jgi:hypothetical protein
MVDRGEGGDGGSLAGATVSLGGVHPTHVRQSTLVAGWE